MLYGGAALFLRHVASRRIGLGAQEIGQVQQRARPASGGRLRLNDLRCECAGPLPPRGVEAGVRRDARPLLLPSRRRRRYGRALCANVRVEPHSAQGPVLPPGGLQGSDGARGP